MTPILIGYLWNTDRCRPGTFCARNSGRHQAEQRTTRADNADHYRSIHVAFAFGISLSQWSHTIVSASSRKEEKKTCSIIFHSSSLSFETYLLNFSFRSQMTAPTTQRSCVILRHKTKDGGRSPGEKWVRSRESNRQNIGSYLLVNWNTAVGLVGACPDVRGTRELSARGLGSLGETPCTCLSCCTRVGANIAHNRVCTLIASSAVELMTSLTAWAPASPNDRWQTANGLCLGLSRFVLELLF